MDEHREHNPGEPEFGDDEGSGAHNPGEPQFDDPESTDPDDFEDDEEEDA